jgi:hypothetical protein
LTSQRLDLGLNLCAPPVIPFTQKVKIPAFPEFAELLIQLRNSAPVLPLRLLVQYRPDVARPAYDQVLLLAKASNC